MVVVFQIFGNVIQRMIVAIARTKEIFVLKKLVHTFNLHVQERVIVFHNRGCVMVMMIALINK